MQNIHNTRLQDRYFEAAIAVLDWDMPEDSEGVYTQAVNAQACHLAGYEAQEDWGDCNFGVDITVH